jgi:hypothetical protein
MPPTIIAERRPTPSFPLPPPYPQQEFAPTIQAGPAASRISRTPRISQKPLTPEELLSRANALIIAAANVSPHNKGVDILRPSDTRGLYPPVNFLPAQSPAIRRLSQRPPLAPAAAPNRRRIQPIPKVAPELLAQVMPSGSHSFKSNSPRDDEKPEFEIVRDEKGTPEVYLIDAVNDGLCFLNAIFDYLLYSDKLSIMYERLSAIEKLILKQDKYRDRDDIKKIKITALSAIGLPINDERLIHISIDSVEHYKNKGEQGQLIRLIGDESLRFKDTDKKVEHLGHLSGDDEKTDYKKQRLIFAISMKYVLALYILSYGKKKFIDMCKFTLETNEYDKEWTIKLKETFKNNYTAENLDGFVYEYVLEYMKDRNFFVNHTLIVMFMKILFKKIKDTSGKNIPRFWLEIATIDMNYELGRIPREDEYPDLRTLTDKGTRTFERVLNKYVFKTSYRATGKNYIHTDKYDNYISLLCDNNRTHYLLFLLKNDTNYAIVDKPTGGGKPKRPKTAATPKPKRPKTATKRPKTAR